MVKIGLLGFSDNNGHPYSFSAILNGYNKDRFKETEWLGILGYLQKRSVEDFCSFDAKITHVWCQDHRRAEDISACCYIDNVVFDYVDMIGYVDAVIIARDDYENHKAMAEPFLNAGIPVMIDKPLTLDESELKWFMSYYDRGLLYSCSGLRFCKELDLIRENLAEFGRIKLVKASVVNHWDKYGVHMLDATLGIWDERIETVSCETQSGIDTYTLVYSNGMVLQINTLGPECFSFSYEVIGEKKSYHTNISDNFSAFKRMLGGFVEQVNNGTPYLKSKSVERSISVMIAGEKAKAQQSTVKVYND
ncbi:MULTISPECIES: Gfo/Idh/MocA family protein [unclassified Agarivorans]|uniref:Gfo/Idh/MocA family protein n=1 Tax=unclassified Agarivorans TaxID=2636026 RepID=UPI0026E35CB3|nr:MULTISPECIES: Gfo/Idh/MocA family oxidoreductase [unclassified Agarivorans]MDO6686267.1 Gfo/Idh/MocA family oxidoreductase [Agarivorans sp. 3_MG-2023]MDO6716284.1 Gfo/Idh/MocA family oxidoreductase [Agarivorans sp. 2_MG-2023]